MSMDVEQLLRAHSDTLHTMRQLISVLQAGPPQRKFQKFSVQLDTVANGSKQVQLPFAAEYMAVINQTPLVISVAEGRFYSAPVGALLLQPGAQQNYLASDTTDLTISWTGTPAAGNNTVIVMVSNEPIPLFSLQPQNQNNPGYVSLSGSKVTNGVLYNQVAANQTGAAATITLPQGNKTLILSVFGDATAAGTLNFMAAGPDGNYGAITGTKLNGFSQAISTANFPQTNATTGVDLWKFDVSGLATFQAPLTWTAGHVSVDWSVMP